MTTETPQSRPVVDAAATETKTSRIIAAVAGVLGVVPATLLSFDLINWTAEQVAQYGTTLGLFVALALVFAGQQTKANALRVESEVTPVDNPMLTQVVKLVANGG